MNVAGYSKDAEATREYATAAFQHVTEGWLGSLKKVWSQVQDTPGLLDELDDITVSFVKREARLAALLPQETSREVRNYLDVLLRDGHVHLLGDVVTEMTRLVTRGPDARVATVTTAVPLQPAEQEEFRKRILAKFGAQVDVEFLVDVKVLGGAVVRIGDRIIDGSVASRLEALHARLRNIR